MFEAKIEFSINSQFLTAYRQQPTFPRIQLRLMRTDTLVIHILWHHFRGALNFVIGATVECMRTLAPYPTIKVHGYNFVSRIFRYINIRYSHIYSRFQPSQSLSVLLVRFVSYLLAYYLYIIGLAG